MDAGKKKKKNQTKDLTSTTPYKIYTNKNPLLRTYTQEIFEKSDLTSNNATSFF